MFHHAPWNDSHTPLASATVFFADLLAKAVHYPSCSGEPVLEVSMIIAHPQHSFLEKNSFPVSEIDLNTFIPIQKEFFGIFVAGSIVSIVILSRGCGTILRTSWANARLTGSPITAIVKTNIHSIIPIVIFFDIILTPFPTDRQIISP